MSAKGRGSLIVPFENYPTPAWCVRRLMEAVNLPGGHWLEPSAGKGAIVRAVDRSDVTWTTVDVRRGSMVRCDFLAWDTLRRFKVAITNPPFSLALPFVQHMRQLADVAIILQRLNWMCGPRAKYFSLNPPDVFVLPNRPSFVGKGTDATEYAWFVWGVGMGNRWRMLDDTPRGERWKKEPSTSAGSCRQRRRLASSSPKESKTARRLSS